MFFSKLKDFLLQDVLKVVRLCFLDLGFSLVLMVVVWDVLR